MPAQREEEEHLQNAIMAYEQEQEEHRLQAMEEVKQKQHQAEREKVHLVLCTSVIYTYKRVVCVCLSVGLSVCFLSATRHLSTLRRCLRVAERAGAVAGGPARGQACTARARARMPYNFSTKKSNADAFQKQNRTRAHAVVYVTAEIFKKREKENQHTTSQVQFTVCLLLECLLFESY